MTSSTGTRIFLGIEALIWLPYGVFCFLQPGFLETAAGIALESATASTEVRAMYGGLEAGIGLMMLAGLVRAGMTRPALLLLAFLCSGLAAARFGGILLDGGVSAYTVAGFGFEFASAAFAIKFLAGRPPIG